MLNNKHLFKPTEPVDEDDVEDCRHLGAQMMAYASVNKYAFLCGNQVGSDRKFVVIEDPEKPTGYHNYANVVVTPVSESIGGELSIAVTPETSPTWVDSPNFRGKLEVEMAPRVKVRAFSVSDNDSVEFETEGILAFYWQVIDTYLEGINQEDVKPRDCTTIRRTGPKPKPNAKCDGCGRKMKRCVCQ